MLVAPLAQTNPACRPARPATAACWVPYHLSPCPACLPTCLLAAHATADCSSSPRLPCLPPDPKRLGCTQSTDNASLPRRAAFESGHTGRRSPQLELRHSEALLKQSCKVASHQSRASEADEGNRSLGTSPTLSMINIQFSCWSWKLPAMVAKMLDAEPWQQLQIINGQ